MRSHPVSWLLLAKDPRQHHAPRCTTIEAALSKYPQFSERFVPLIHPHPDSFIMLEIAGRFSATPEQIRVRRFPQQGVGRRARTQGWQNLDVLDLDVRDRSRRRR